MFNPTRRGSGQTARSATRRNTNTHPVSIFQSYQFLLSSWPSHFTFTVETYGYQRKTSRQHRQIYKVWRPRFNLLLVSDDSCMKTCERSRWLRAAELNPLQPAAVCAESTPQPNEGIYSAAQTCGRGQRTINSDPQISADMMNILQSTQACQKILHLKYDVFRSASVHRHLMFAQKFAEKQNYSFVYLFSGQTFSIYSSDTNMSGHGGFSLIKPLLTRRT